MTDLRDVRCRIQMRVSLFKYLPEHIQRHAVSEKSLVGICLLFCRSSIGPHRKFTRLCPLSSAVSDQRPAPACSKAGGRGYFDAATVQSEWLAGFMNAMNMVWYEPTMQITAGAAEMDDWIRKWCERSPSRVLVHAAAAFVREQFLTQLSK